jgi:DNA-binding NtrC family response regulator
MTPESSAIPDPAPAYRSRVLVVDDEESMRHFVARALAKAEFEVDAAASAEEALTLIEQAACDVLVSDIRMPGRDGVELMSEVRRRCPGVRTVLMTAFGTVNNAIEAMQRGAETYLTKPFETAELVAAVQKAAEKARLSAENRVLHEMLASGGAYAGLVGGSRTMRQLYRRIDQVAQRSGTVLISGESGTGKGLVARAVHRRSPWKEGPFVSVHCGSLPESLVEAELFGVVEGAYTGATRSRSGYVERARGGTLLLDEIAEIPTDVQVTLLRFLDDGELIRVGGTEVERVEVRVVVATNRDLHQLVEQGRFRDDLYYRLDVLPLKVPPLRERREDIPLLLTHFLANAGRPELCIPPDVMAFLQGREYEGNVRELQNLAERLAVLVDGDVVEFESLPGDVRGEAGAAESFRPYRQAMENFERRYLEGLLDRTGGNVSEAARLGGLGRPSLHARIAALGIDVHRFRAAK